MDDIEALAEELTPRERAFCQEYVVDFNATAAVLRAGWKQTRPAAANKGSKLMRKDAVRAYIDALLKERAGGAGASRESVVSRLLDITQRCMSAEPVKEWDPDQKAWVDSGEYRFDSRGATNALAQLSKILGYDLPGEPGVTDTISIGFEAGTDGDGD